MKGKIVSFRRSRHTQHTNHMIVEVEGVNTNEAASKLVGKKAVWKSPSDKIIEGKIAAVHGNKGRLRVLFEKGMPGQSLASSLEIQ